MTIFGSTESTIKPNRFDRCRPRQEHDYCTIVTRRFASLAVSGPRVGGAAVPSGTVWGRTCPWRTRTPCSWRAGTRGRSPCSRRGAPSGTAPGCRPPPRGWRPSICPHPPLSNAATQTLNRSTPTCNLGHAVNYHFPKIEHTVFDQQLANSPRNKFFGFKKKKKKSLLSFFKFGLN